MVACASVGPLRSSCEVLPRLQADICSKLAELDGAKDFGADAWQRPGGGGGVARVLEGGAVFEKAGVNWSDVDGELPAELASHMPGTGTTFRASGVSLVLHPRSPMVPTTHANFRCIEKGDAIWFGGGADLTPYYFHPRGRGPLPPDACRRLRPPQAGRRLRPRSRPGATSTSSCRTAARRAASAASSSTTSAPRASTRPSASSSS